MRSSRRLGRAGRAIGLIPFEMGCAHGFISRKYVNSD
ncbi:hypothetical protein DM47_3567 [Burkholderia mallei]|nr:hypothetical protein BPC006_I2559 [Burkholderia pseudomallei BPC006]KGC80581.1 hypothetical protein DP61_5731 [Burkholderia pseudomallei]KGX75104.1 hypothetical protein Y033_5825 [Burkholderia pseudomallei MSHR435]KOS77268.1 hypothetical protein DM46_2875 [Burkholderia mallei]KGC97919.1 hypothetical protein DO63_5684 [Burkholderia pseudomallei]